MAKPFFNFEYFSMWREIPLLLFLELVKPDKKSVKSDRILIINPCLVGEFAASIPAIFDFIKRNPTKKIDLLVTPQIEKIAKRISGVHEVFVTKSAYLARDKDKVNYLDQKFNHYERIIVLRISELTYRLILNMQGSEIQTSFPVFGRYVLHLIKSLILGKTPRRWRTLNFDILGGQEQDFPLAEMFVDWDKGLASGHHDHIFDPKRKNVIVHVGTKWLMKRWDNNNWTELLKKINEKDDFHFVFIGNGSFDQSDYEYISKKLDFKTSSLIDKVDLSEILHILKKAHYFIGIDSGPANLAHLVDLRSLTLYGPGPHMYLPNNPLDKYIDKTNGRGLSQLMFAVKDSYIKKITVAEALEAFKALTR